MLRLFFERSCGLCWVSYFFLHVKNFTTLVFFHVSMDFGMFCNIFSVHEGHLNSWP